MTTDQLRQQARYHRDAAGNFRGPTHQVKNTEEQSNFFILTQTILAEVYEELIEYRERQEPAKVA
jgi:hypothetical protein